MNLLVTGGSRGIGFAVARRLAEAGHSVTLCARNADLLKARAGELAVESERQKHNVWSLDMSDLAAVSEMAGCPRPLAEYSGLVNCAGVAGTGLFATQSVSGIGKTLAVNLHAPILMAKHLTRAMLRGAPRGASHVSGAAQHQHQHQHQKDGEQPRKHLIFMSSVLASRGAAGSAVYSATKAGLEGFARSLAREVGSRNIAVNCVAPGVVDTDMGVKADTKLMEGSVFPGLIPAEAVAETVMYILNSRSITGQTFTIDNGLSA